MATHSQGNPHTESTPEMSNSPKNEGIRKPIPWNTLLLFLMRR
jgi:hypothetical protein